MKEYVMLVKKTVSEAGYTFVWGHLYLLKDVQIKYRR